MKALIMGLLSLTMLSACAGIIKPKMAPTPLPPAAQGFCNANNGIFVIWVDNQGNQNAFLCPKINGKDIRQENALPPGLVLDNDINLGKVKKFNIPNDPDPCIDWYVNGQHYYFCW